MKAILKICIPLCVLSFIAFGISVAVFGTNSSAGHAYDEISKMYQIDGEYSQIEADIGAYDLVLEPHSGNTTEVNISGRYTKNINVGTTGDTLTIYAEHNGFDVSSWFKRISDWGSRTTVTVTVPDKIYQKMDIGVSSGSANVSGISAKNVELSTTSGSLKYFQPDFTTDSLTIKTTSGTIDALDAATSSYDIRSTSGDINVSALTGTGNIRASSGNLNIGFKELNGDCYVNVTSGNIALGLPWDVSANIHCSKTSGNVTMTTFDGTTSDSADLGSTDTTLGGGEHKVNINLTSGDVELVRSVNSSFFAEDYIGEIGFAETTALDGNSSFEPVTAVEDVAETVGNKIENAAEIAGDKIDSALSEVESRLDAAFN